MANWTIKAIKAGQLTVSKAIAGGNVDAELIVDVPFTCFLLRNGTENILVDTGLKDSDLQHMQIGDVNAQGGTQYLLDGLKEEGLTPADITAVIYTHLHYDHCGNGALFLDVPTYVQKAEYDNLMNPYDFQQIRADYFPDAKEWIRELKQLILVDGYMKLDNGLELYLTKGHSLGGQTIVVPTAKGKYVMTGDVPNLLCNLFPKMDKMTLMDGTVVDITPVDYQRYTIGVFMNDFFSTYDSHDLQMSLAERPEPEFFITSHEPSNIYRKYWG